MKKWLLSIVVAISLVSLLGCGSSEEAATQETTFEKVKREGFVTVGFANEAPYAYATPDGKLTGEAVEIARVILQRLGIEEMNGVLTEFGSLIPGLKANRFDMITAGMYITADRAKEVDFANPEYSIGEGIAVVAGNPINIKSYEDIVNNSDVKVAVMGGAIQFNYLTSVGVKESQIHIVPDNPSALDALIAGRVDVIAMTGPSLQAVLDAANNDRVERVMDFVQPVIDGVNVRGYGATAFRKGETDFVDVFNAELEKLKESGELLEILEQFGFTEQELPGDATVDSLTK
ncbi:ectoine/hydroxyectoine ABC transporter substrate-binding protein EhuB [Anaerobacillus alkalilacustris]|uniref:Ectoine/hydroxyectoine ABC transporter substrate-binding protein EhuB n=1 Tax=Anaerobacillus alkalilacustris TaxID=393763 RepID=A0A1S2LQH3_9BACI|nr:ectoine/hydroxyectoine ABC transporter substrate-binding protein EhuB [Anaerobacillus alkalilacustris]OIJ13645.1 ectoine/hydroxyectoine ABC transporter substrate-binding protein EhuB [Anaerobacillus alkalilacustris]